MGALVTLNELRRHLVFKLTGKPGVGLLGTSAQAKRKHLEKPTASARFEAIYRQGIWQNGQAHVPASGPGSSIAATRGLRLQLPALLDELEAATLLDLGCGDFTWMKDIDLKQNYIGVDIVEPVIAQSQRFAGPKRQFHCANAIQDPLPAADAVLCRETLFHLSFADGKRLLSNLFGQPRKWFLCTTETTTWFNADIHTGDYRPLNLRFSPYNFPPPDRLIDDSAVKPGRMVGVWRVSKLAV